jgi:hypothetical protein
LQQRDDGRGPKQGFPPADGKANGIQNVGITP